MSFLVPFITGIAAFAFGWWMRGRLCRVDLAAAEDAAYRKGFRRGLAAPFQPLKKPQAPTCNTP